MGKRADKEPLDENMTRHFMESFMFELTTVTIRSYLMEKYGDQYNTFMRARITQWEKGQLKMLEEDLQEAIKSRRKNISGPVLVGNTPDVEEMRVFHVKHIKYVKDLLLNNFCEGG